MPSASLIDALLARLGPAVLLPIHAGKKSPDFPGWDRVSLLGMEGPLYRARLLRSVNLGVLLGAPSRGLCTIDVDSDAHLAAFLELNPKLARSLRTRRARGGNIWVRVQGAFPRLHKLTLQPDAAAPSSPAAASSRSPARRRSAPPPPAPPSLTSPPSPPSLTSTPPPPTSTTPPPPPSTAWGEWRADGGQTVIHGSARDRDQGETASIPYKIVVDAKPVKIRFEEIRWPAEVRLPWLPEETPSPTLPRPSPTPPSPARCRVHPSSSSPPPPSPSSPPPPPTPPAPPKPPAPPSPPASGPARPDDSKPSGGPILILPGHEYTILDCARRIFTHLARTRQMFVRGGSVSELITGPGAGNLALDVLTASALRSRLETVGKVLAPGKNNRGETVLKAAVCSRDLAQALLDSPSAREKLPRITLVIGCAVATEGEGGAMRAAGGALRVLGRGYHEALGGILVTARALPPRVEISRAVAALQSLLDDFDFQTPSDRARALAALLTPALSIGGFLAGRAPADVAEADQSQAGKGYRQKLVAALYGEQPYVVAQRRGGVGGLEESFCQALIAGRPFIQLDNLRGAFDSPFFEAFFTADAIGARVPHRAEVPVDPRRFFVFASSNGVDTTPDFANRASFVRIRKRVGHPFRAYPEGDLLGHLRARQTFYLGCVFSVLAEWLAFGKPRTAECRHDFRDWAQTLDWIVQHIFHAAPLLDGHQEAQERVSNPALNLLRALCLAAARDDPALTGSWTASRFAELAEEHGIAIPGLERGDEDRAMRQIGIQLRRVFKAGEAVAVDGFVVTRDERVENRADGRGERAVKYYRLRREGGGGC